MLSSELNSKPLRKGTRHEDHQYRDIYRGRRLEALDVRQSGDGRGVTGWGECSDGRSPHGIEGTIRDLKPLLIGRTPGRSRCASRTCTAPPGRVREASRPRRLPGLDCAFIDIKAKALGISVTELFGGPTRQQVRVYWSHCGSSRIRHYDLIGLSSHRLLGRRDQPGARGEGAGLYGSQDEHPHAPAIRPRSGVASAEASAPPTSMLRSGSSLTSRKLIGTFRDAVGDDIDINLDLNFHFKTEGALRIAKVLEQFDMLWLEVDMYEPEEPASDQGLDHDAHLHGREPLLHARLHSVLREPLGGTCS